MKEIFEKIKEELMKKSETFHKFPYYAITYDDTQITFPLVKPVNIYIRRDKIRLSNGGDSTDIVIIPKDLIQESVNIILFLALMHGYVAEGLFDVANSMLKHIETKNKEVLN